MSNPYFRFKQFIVYHDKCAMKVGVDGVTLGAWADTSGAKTVLDAGCGSGLIALMLAQRCEAQITAVDINADSVAQTIENVMASLWNERIAVENISLQHFAESHPGQFDLIVSNPPFFVNSLKNHSEARTQARHSDTLSHNDLIISVSKLLNNEGKLCVILPVVESYQFIDMAEKANLFCIRKVTVYPNNTKPAKRVLLQLGKGETVCSESSLVIEAERNIYTQEYAELVKDFYLRL